MDDTKFEVLQQRIDSLLNDIKRVEHDVREIRDAQKGSQQTTFMRVWAFTTQMALPLVILLGTAAYNLDTRVRTIENTRFTAADFNKAIGDLASKVNGGPEWMRDAFSKLQATIDITRSEVSSLKERQIRLETKIEK